MKKPDRFALLVEREAKRQIARGRWIWSAKEYTQVVERLLRAEHKVVVRLVKQQTILAGNVIDRGVLIAALAWRTR